MRAKNMLFETSDFLFGVRVLRTYNQNNSFFREFKSDFLIGDKYLRYFPVILQTLTTSAMAYAAMKGHSIDFLFPLCIKSLLYLNFRNDEQTTRNLRREILEESIFEEELKRCHEDYEGEQWKIGTEYPFSEDQ